jgi:hypothetical protein
MNKAFFWYYDKLQIALVAKCVYWSYRANLYFSS